MNNQFIILSTEQVQQNDFIGVVTVGITTVEVPQDAPFLNVAYQLLDCERVDVIPLMINGKHVDAWFDEEFLLRNQSFEQPSFIFSLANGAEVPIFGKVLLAGLGEDSETTSAIISSDEVGDALRERLIRIGSLKTITDNNGRITVKLS